MGTVTGWLDAYRVMYEEKESDSIADALKWFSERSERHLYRLDPLVDLLDRRVATYAVDFVHFVKGGCRSFNSWATAESDAHTVLKKNFQRKRGKTVDFPLTIYCSATKGWEEIDVESVFRWLAED